VKITKREFFELWEGVKAQFYIDTNLLASSRNLNRLAYEINKANPNTSGFITDKYLRNKLKVFNAIDSTVTIRTNIYIALKNYSEKQVVKKELFNELKKHKRTKKEKVKKHESIIDKMERMIEKDSALKEKKEVHNLPPKDDIQSSPVELMVDLPQSVEEDKDSDILKLSDLVMGEKSNEEQLSSPEPTFVPELEDEHFLKKEDAEEHTSEIGASVESEIKMPETSSVPPPIQVETELEGQPQIIVKKPIFSRVELPIKVKGTKQDLSQLDKPELVEIKAVNEGPTATQKKGLLLVSLIAITFIIGFVYNEFSASNSRTENTIPSYMVENKTAENTMEDFFDLINQKDYKQAFALTDNELWNPYAKFIKSDVWGGFENLSQPAILVKDYTSKYGGDEILEVSFYAFDMVKQRNLFLKYDFHLAKRGEVWIIVRMTYVK